MAMAVAQQEGGTVSTISIEGPGFMTTGVVGPAAAPAFGVTISSEPHTSAAYQAAHRTRLNHAGPLMDRSSSPTHGVADGRAAAEPDGAAAKSAPAASLGPGEVVGLPILHKFDSLDILAAQAQAVRLHDQKMKELNKAKDARGASAAGRSVANATHAGLHLDAAATPASANTFTMPLIYDRQKAVLEKERTAKTRINTIEARAMSAQRGGNGGVRRRARQRSASAPVPQEIRNLRSPEPTEEEELQNVLVARGSPPKGIGALAAEHQQGRFPGSNHKQANRARSPQHRTAGGPVPNNHGPILQPAWSIAKIKNPNEAAEATSDTFGYELGVDTSGTSLGMMMAPANGGAGGGNGGGAESGPAPARAARPGLGPTKHRGETRFAGEELGLLDHSGGGLGSRRAGSSPPKMRTPHYVIDHGQSVGGPPGYTNIVAGKVFMPTRQDTSPFRSRLVIQKDPYETRIGQGSDDGMYPSRAARAATAGPRHHRTRSVGSPRRARKSDVQLDGPGFGIPPPRPTSVRPSITKRHRRAHSAPYAYQLQRQQSASVGRHPISSASAAAQALEAQSGAAARANEPTYVGLTVRGGSAAAPGNNAEHASLAQGVGAISSNLSEGGDGPVLVGNANRFVSAKFRPSDAAAGLVVSRSTKLPAVDTRGGSAKPRPKAAAAEKVLTVPTGEVAIAGTAV